jgi:type I site-specific restriction endonuclease
MEKYGQTTSEKLADWMRKAAVEIEEFQVQFALGKAEAEDKFEEVKHNFREFIHEAKGLMDKGQEKSKDIQAVFEELQLQLNLGKAETKEVFSQQKAKIAKALSDLEEYISSTETGSEILEKTKAEIEKFKIKMEILRLRYELGKKDAEDEFESRKKDFLDKVDEIKKRFSEKQNTSEDKWSQFKKEMGSAFDHVKKAFNS